MEKEPKRLIIRLLEWAAIFAIAAFLLKLGVAYLKEIWVPLIIVIAAIFVIVIGVRIWQNQGRW